LLKAETDVEHLWYGRRAATRIKSELMAAIYDKALKRKDYSGVVEKGGKEEGSEGGGRKTPGSLGTTPVPGRSVEGSVSGSGSEGVSPTLGDVDGKDKKELDGQRKKEKKRKEEEEEKKDDPKAGADVGKIVNLMAGDANRVGFYLEGLFSWEGVRGLGKVLY
jgi:hypothetical protein